MVTVRVFPDFESLSAAAAAIMRDTITANPTAFLSLATGSTPLLAYKVFCEHGKTTPRVFENFRVIQIDEWGGLAPHHPASCAHYLRCHLLDPLGVGKERVIVMAGDASSATFGILPSTS